MTDQPVKRGPGRPPKSAGVEREDMERPAKSLKMRANPNWETIDPGAEESPDRLAIAKNLIPEGMDLQWVTKSVFGQDVPTHRAAFERKGWTPVHQDDFDGQFNGRWMARGEEGEITVDGLVLMARPKELSQAAAARDQRNAREVVQIRERDLRNGNLQGVTLDPSNAQVLQQVNKVGRSVERIDVPKD